MKTRCWSRRSITRRLTMWTSGHAGSHDEVPYRHESTAFCGSDSGMYSFSSSRVPSGSNTLMFLTWAPGETVTAWPMVPGALPAAAARPACRSRAIVASRSRVSKWKCVSPGGRFDPAGCISRNVSRLVCGSDANHAQRQALGILSGSPRLRCFLHERLGNELVQFQPDAIRIVDVGILHEDILREASLGHGARRWAIRRRCRQARLAQPRERGAQIVDDEMSMGEAGSHVCGRLLHFQERIAAHLKKRVRSRAVLARELESDRKSHDALVERLRLRVIADRNPDEAQPEATALPRLALSRAWLQHDTHDEDAKSRCEQSEPLHLISLLESGRPYTPVSLCAMFESFRIGARKICRP